VRRLGPDAGKPHDPVERHEPAALPSTAAFVVRQASIAGGRAEPENQGGRAGARLLAHGRLRGPVFPAVRRTSVVDATARAGAGLEWLTPSSLLHSGNRGGHRTGVAGRAAAAFDLGEEIAD